MPMLRLAEAPVRTRPVRLPAFPGDGPVPVRTPADMAKLLRGASRRGALAHARAMHERACAGCDEERLRFWAAVLGLLAAPPAPLADAPSTHP